MNGFLRLFIPHHSNNYHPHFTRHYALIIYSLLFSVLNLFIFPAIGFKNGITVLANDLEENKIIELTNLERIKRNIAPLIRNEQLEKAALAKGKDIFEKQYWNHYGPNGESPWQFMLQQNYDYIYAGENLAKDFENSTEVINAWMNSPTHKANIINPKFSEIGIAVVSGILNGKESTVIVQMFGSRKTFSTHVRLNDQNSTRNIENYRPEITNPKHNTTINKSIIEITGISKFGDMVTLYTNNESKGEIPLNGGFFSERFELQEGINILQVQSIDSSQNKTSIRSNPVTINIDTIPPDISQIKVEISKQVEEGYVINTKTSAEIHKVIAEVNGKNVILNLRDNTYTLTVKQDVKQITLKYYDQVGNFTSKQINLEEFMTQDNTKRINNVLSSDSAFLIGLNDKNFSLQGFIDLIFISVILSIILLDVIFLLKHGHVREWASKHSFHISLIVVFLLGVVVI
ncbi:MAG: hypothetical protein KatS3mg084_0419 [Candidatus Dojkabacteria bacterium]|nr:MAG: hypothetical protein KatS3mg084_0419 [Candidatus Dojkabacteria bacterium]